MYRARVLKQLVSLTYDVDPFKEHHEGILVCALTKNDIVLPGSLWWGKMWKWKLAIDFSVLTYRELRERLDMHSKCD